MRRMPLPLSFLGATCVLLALPAFAPPLNAQMIDARTSLILPTNPPRAAGKQKLNSSVLEGELIASALGVQLQIAQARSDGLGDSHPKIKSLQARLDVMTRQAAESAARSPGTELENLKKSLAVLALRQDQEKTARENEIAALKTEIARLNGELKKLQK